MKPRLKRDRVLNILERELPYLQRQYGVVRLALYGSFSHSAPTEKSDVDLLVETSRPLGLEFVTLAHYLEQQLGRRVDLATFETLRRSREHSHYARIAQEIERTLTDVRAPA
jgi:predicted nucleotidyltransferase